MNTIRHLFALGLLAALPVLSASAEEPHKFGPPGSWNRTGVWDSDFIYCFRDGWVFPLGTNHLSDIAVWSQGSLFAKHTDWDPFASVGASLLVIARRSHVSCGPTSSNSYLFAWENCFPDGDTNSPITASIELFRNGHIVVTSNGVVRTTRHVNWFDVDDDGIPDDADPDPQVPDPDGFTRWQTLPEDANPDNYCWIEIVSPYEDALVRFVGDAPSDYSDPYFVARANETNRVPLLIGKEYAVESSCPVEITGRSDPGIETWTTGDGRTELCRNVFFSVDGIGGGGFTVETSPSGLVGDYIWCDGCCPVVKGEGNVFVFACDADCTCGGCSACGRFDYEGYSLYVNESSCGCRPHEEGDPLAPYSSLQCVSTLFNNDDKDVGLEDDLVPLTVSFGSSGVATSAELTYTGAKLGFWDSREKIHEIHLPRQYASAVGEHTETIWVEGRAVSAGYGDQRLSLTWTDELGRSGSEVRRLTLVEPIVEPVCTARRTADGIEYICNPSGVAVGGKAYFKIGLNPGSYPDGKIVWSAYDFTAEEGYIETDDDGMGEIEFVDGNRGREVCVRGVKPGIVRLRIKIGDSLSAAPEFRLRVVRPQTVVLSAWIVLDENNVPATTVERVREMVAEANVIYRQVGVSFDIGDRIVVTNLPKAFTIYTDPSYARDGTAWSKAMLNDAVPQAEGFRCFFVDTIFDHDYKGNPVGINGLGNVQSVAVSSSAVKTTLAHEIGHAFGMTDIYRNKTIHAGGKKTTTTLPDDLTSRGWLPYDWNGGCAGVEGARYYPMGTLQPDLVQKMLMYGYGNRIRGDIPYGPAYGVNSDGVIGLTDIGFFRWLTGSFDTERTRTPPRQHE